MERRQVIVSRFAGSIFVAGGLVNLFGLGESIPDVFSQMATANAATRIGPISAWVAAMSRWRLPSRRV